MTLRSYFFPLLLKKARIQRSDNVIFSFFTQIFCIEGVCHEYHLSLCPTLHEPRTSTLTLDYVVHTSIIRFGVGIDVYCSTCLSVLWNKTMFHVVHVQIL